MGKYSTSGQYGSAWVSECGRCGFIDNDGRIHAAKVDPIAERDAAYSLLGVITGEYDVARLAPFQVGPWIPVFERAMGVELFWVPDSGEYGAATASRRKV